jgi:hypothetical protein
MIGDCNQVVGNRLMFRIGHFVVRGEVSDRNNDVCVDLFAAVPSILEALEMDNEDLWQFPDIQLLESTLMSLTLWTVPGLKSVVVLLKLQLKTYFVFVQLLPTSKHLNAFLQSVRTFSGLLQVDFASFLV